MEGSVLVKPSSCNVALKNATLASATVKTMAASGNSFSTGNLADSLPEPSTRTTNTPSMKNSTWGSGANFGSHPTYTNNINGNNRNLGGPSMKNGAGVSASSKK